MALILASTTVAEAKKDPEREREPITRAHAVGVGYYFHWLTSDNTGGMRFHGPSVGYLYDRGRKIRFLLHSKVVFPVVGRMDNEHGNYDGKLRSDYSPAWGVDATFAVGRKWEFDDMTLVVGGGVHMMGMRLNSSELYAIESVTMGAGGIARLRWKLGQKDLFHVGVDGHFAADVFSLLRQQNKVNLLLTGSVLGTIGIKF